MDMCEEKHEMWISPESVFFFWEINKYFYTNIYFKIYIKYYIKDKHIQL